MLACEKSFERYLLDTLQSLVIGKEPNLHQHANLAIGFKVTVQICLYKLSWHAFLCQICTSSAVFIWDRAKFEFEIVPNLVPSDWSRPCWNALQATINQPSMLVCCNRLFATWLSSICKLMLLPKLSVCVHATIIMQFSCMPKTAAKSTGTCRLKQQHPNLRHWAAWWLWLRSDSPLKREVK